MRRYQGVATLTKAEQTCFYPPPFSGRVKEVSDGLGRERSSRKCVKIHAMGFLTDHPLEFSPVRRKM
jgi:hypothetical protein